jgi:hypothetical protein
MRRVLKVGVLVFSLVAPLAGCVVREHPTACSPAATQIAYGCAWIQPYTDVHGHYHAAHWRCPGTTDAY